MQKTAIDVLYENLDTQQQQPSQIISICSQKIAQNQQNSRAKAAWLMLKAYSATLISNEKLALDSYNEAIATRKKIIDQYPNDYIDALRGKAFFLENIHPIQSKKTLFEAFSIFKKYRHSDKIYDLKLDILGDLCNVWNEKDSVLSMMRYLPSNEMSDIKAKIYLKYAALEAQNTEKAIQFAKEALVFFKNNQDSVNLEATHLVLANKYLLQSDYQTAHYYLNACADSPEKQLVITELAYLEGNYAKCKTQIQHLKNTDYQQFIQYYEAKILIEEKGFIEAEKKLKALLKKESEPNNQLKYQIDLATCLLGQNQLQNARKMIENIINQATSSHDKSLSIAALKVLSQIELANDAYKNALQTTEKIAILTGKNANYYADISQIWKLKARKSNQKNDWNEVYKNAQLGLQQLDSLLKKQFNNQQQLAILQFRSLFMESIFDNLVESSIELGQIEEALHYADYAKTNASSPTLSVHDILPKIPAQKLFVEYHFAKDRLFIFTILNGQIQQKTSILDRDSIKNLIFSFRNQLSKANNINLEQDYADFAAISYQLYQIFIAPIAPLLQNEIVLIPDHDIVYIPFDALINSPITKENEQYFKTYPFLFKAHSFCFSQSLSHYFKADKKEFSLKNWLGKKALLIAPSFSGKAFFNRFQVSPLHSNMEEAQKISELLKNDLLNAEKATKSNFISQLKKETYDIIHFSTHALMSDENEAYIFFSDVNHQDFALSMQELNQLTLSTDLVFLSACQSAAGYAYRGAGVMSLSNAFQQIGAKNVVASLWNVDDVASVKLMEYYYNYIKKGVSYNEALHKAKLDYLNNEPNIKPFYWAAFVFYGNDSYEKPNYLLYGLLCAGLLFLYFIVKTYAKIRS